MVILVLDKIDFKTNITGNEERYFKMTVNKLGKYYNNYKP